MSNISFLKEDKSIMNPDITRLIYCFGGLLVAVFILLIITILILLFRNNGCECNKKKSKKSRRKSKKKSKRYSEKYSKSKECKCSESSE